MQPPRVVKSAGPVALAVWTLLAMAGTVAATTQEQAMPPGSLPEEPVATRALDEGKDLYLAARFGMAIVRLQQAIHGLEQEPDVARRRTQLADAFLHLGLAFLAEGEREAARDAFKNVLRLDPDFRPNAEIYAPKVVELFEQARLGLPVAAAEGRELGTAEGREAVRTRPAGKLRVTLDLSTMRARFAEMDVTHMFVPQLPAELGSGWVAGPRAAYAGARLMFHLPNGRDRLEIEGRQFWSGSQVQEQAVNAWLPFGSDHEIYYKGTRDAFTEVQDMALLDARWVRRVGSGRWWTLDLQCGYQALRAELRRGLDLTTDPRAWQYFPQWNERSSSVRSHGVRLGLLANRALAGPLSAEAEVGYGLHASKDVAHGTGLYDYGVDPKNSYDNTTTEIRASFDVSVAARLKLARWTSLRVGLCWWRHMGDYFAGPLTYSGATIALRLGATPH